MVDLNQLINQLRSGEFQERWDAVKALNLIGEEVIEPVLKLLERNTDDPDLDWFIAQLLGQFEHPDAIMAMIQLLGRAEDEDLRFLVAQNILQLGAAPLERLLPMLDNPTLRLPILKALSHLPQESHPDSHGQFLMPYTQDPNPTIRTLVMECLGEYRDSDHHPHFILALQDFHPDVRRSALIALGRLSFSPTEAGEVLRNQLVEAIAPHLGDLTPSVATQAAYTLGRLNCPLAYNHLWQQLVNAGPQELTLALALIQSLSWSEHVVGVGYLLTLLKRQFQWGNGIPWATGTTQTPEADPAPLLQELIISVIATLARVESPALIPEICAGLQAGLTAEGNLAQPLAIQRSLVTALGQLRDQSALDLLISALAIEDLVLRLHIVAALRQINLPQSHTLLGIRQTQGVTPPLAEGIALALAELARDLESLEDVPALKAQNSYHLR
jgi:HEAT repeat protein